MAETYDQYSEFEPRTVLLLVLADALTRAEEAQRVDLQLQLATGRGIANENLDHLRGRMEQRAEAINFLVAILDYYEVISEAIDPSVAPESEL